MIFRQLTGFRTFSRTHGGLSETMVGTPKNTHPREISPYVSTKILLTISAFKPNQLFFFYRGAEGMLEMTTKSSSPLIHTSLPRRNSNGFPLGINKTLVLASHYATNWLVESFRVSLMTAVTGQRRRRIGPTHQTLMGFYITLHRQTDPALQENCASELHQAMILPLSPTVRTSCEWMVNYGHGHFTLSQNYILLCIKNWGKIDLFQMTWTTYCQISLKRTSYTLEVNFFIH